MKMLINHKDAQSFYENISLQLRAGVGISEAVSSASELFEKPKQKSAVKNLLAELDSGNNLSKSLKKTGLAHENTLPLLESGEKTGDLEKNLAMASEYLAKEQEFRSRLMSAALYPAIVLGLALVVGTGVFIFLLPRIATLYATAGVTNSAFANAVIGIGNYIDGQKTMVVLYTIIFFGLFIGLTFVPKVRSQMLKALKIIPGMRRLETEVDMARFGYILGNMIAAGIPVVDSIRAVNRSVSGSKLKLLISELESKIDSGISFAEVLDESKYKKAIPLSARQVIKAGEKSGSLSDVLLEMNKHYESRSEITSKNIAIIIEPILLFVIWVFVLLLALSVIVPIYSLIGELGE